MSHNHFMRAAAARNLLQCARNQNGTRVLRRCQTCSYSSSPVWHVRPTDNHIDLERLLSKPTWSVASLLPSNDSPGSTPTVTSRQLHHLLRLSALPPPKDEREEREMLATLSSQLHFVKEIQRVDITGVKPLHSLRDETLEGERVTELGLDALQDALAKEEIRGKHHKRIRRKGDVQKQLTNDSQWDVLGNASKKVGRYLVVEGGKINEHRTG